MIPVVVVPKLAPTLIMMMMMLMMVIVMVVMMLMVNFTFTHCDCIAAFQGYCSAARLEIRKVRNKGLDIRQRQKTEKRFGLKSGR